MRNISKLILILIFINIGFVHSTSNYENNEVNKSCEVEVNEKISYLWLKIKNWTKDKIDKIIPTLEKKYLDNELLALNKKLFKLIDKTQKDSERYNLYVYILLKIDVIIDNSLYDLNYNKSKCLLLSKLPTKDTLYWVKKTQAELELLKERRKFQSEEDNKELTKNIKKSIDGSEIHTDINDDQYIEKLASKMDLTKEEIIESINLTRNTFENNFSATPEQLEAYEKNQKSISDEERKYNLISAKKEFQVPHWLDRDIRYDISITKKERAILWKLEDEFLILGTKISKIKDKKVDRTADILTRVNNSTNRSNELAKLEYKENQLTAKKLDIIRKKWERKNMCITISARGDFFKDRDTLKNVSTLWLEEKMNLKNDYYFGRRYGYNMSCRFFQVYPELNAKTFEIEKMSDSILKEKKNKSLSFIPTETNYNYDKYPRLGKLPWNTRYEFWRVFTWYEQAKEDYEIAKQMKKIVFTKSEDIINIQLQKNDIYDDRF